MVIPVQATFASALKEHSEMQRCIESMRSLNSLDPLMQEFLNQLVALAEAAAGMVTESAEAAGLANVYRVRSADK